MPGIQTRTQKSKSAAPKIAGRRVIAAAKPRQAKAEARTVDNPGISAQEREAMVAQAAYFRAERRGFAPGGELQDWAEAEAEVLRLIGGA